MDINQLLAARGIAPSIPPNGPAIAGGTGYSSMAGNGAMGGMFGGSNGGVNPRVMAMVQMLRQRQAGGPTPSGFAGMPANGGDSPGMYSMPSVASFNGGPPGEVQSQLMGGTPSRVQMLANMIRGGGGGGLGAGAAGAAPMVRQQPMAANNGYPLY